jgi:hypothetical protein
MKYDCPICEEGSWTPSTNHRDASHVDLKIILRGLERELKAAEETISNALWLASHDGTRVRVEGGKTDARATAVKAEQALRDAVRYYDSVKEQIENIKKCQK